MKYVTIVLLLTFSMSVGAQDSVYTYKLYPTQNIWTFLKLNTRNGKIWQVQFSVKGDDYRFETPLNEIPLTKYFEKDGRFELYPTQNMYNFILLDRENGDCYQVQWSNESENRGVLPIKHY